jgi:hypothetical protein
MDVNLKKEIVLDGANIDILPSIPALMITDRYSLSLTYLLTQLTTYSLTHSTCTKPGITVKKSKKDQSINDKNNQLVSAVLGTHSLTHLLTHSPNLTLTHSLRGITQ